MTRENDQHLESRGDSEGSSESGIHRRQLLGGGLALGGLFLVGCQTTRSASLPGPAWPTIRDEGGVIKARPLPPPPTAVAPAPTTEVPTGIVSRSAWTRSGVARPRDINPMNGVSRITVHHSGINSSDLRSSSLVVRELEGIRSGHVGRGWADIGYHYIIDPFGRVYEGRATRFQGAHVENNNEHNLGIMVLGNFDQQTPTPQAQASLMQFVRSQMSQYNVPVSRVYTHRELKPTACPGRTLQQMMIRSRQGGGGLA
ncbi:MAG: peptidoglycan recognition family protein [Phycisphaerales bacterium]